MQTITRQRSIDALREKLLTLTDADHSICEVAAEKCIFCRGFAQWTFDELKRRYWWIADPRPGITRPELERLANIWQVARQQVFGTQLACDSQTLEHDTCRGFDDFSNAELGRFHAELLGAAVRVVDDAED
jgi:hypothetical protein